MDAKQLQQVFNKCDVGWIFSEDAVDTTARLLAEIGQVEHYCAETLHRQQDTPLQTRILADVDRYKPLVQTFASPMTTPMRAMVLCILEGAQVQRIGFDYSLKQRANIQVELEFESGERASFSSADVWDAEVLRHFGLMKIDAAPVIDGYYAFRKG